MRFTLYFVAFILLVACILLIVGGLNIETTVQAPSGSELPAGLQGISNLQLMHVQLLDIILGVGAGLGSILGCVGAAVVGAIHDEAWATKTVNG